LTLKSNNRIFILYLGNLLTHVPVPRRSCPSQHQCYPLLGHERSEQWYDTSDLLVLCTTSCHYSALLTDDMILLCKKIPVPNLGFSFSSCRIVCIPLRVRCHRSPIWPALPLNLTYILIVIFATITSEPALYKLIAFHVPNLITIFLCLGRLSKESVQVRGSCKKARNNLIFLRRGGARGPPLVVCHRLLIHCIRSYLPVLEAIPPCCGDKGPI
jgi:hypothetical protein